MSSPFQPSSVSIKITDLVPGGTVEFMLNAGGNWDVRLLGDPKPAAGNFPTFIGAIEFAQEEFSKLSAEEIRKLLTANSR